MGRLLISVAVLWLQAGCSSPQICTAQYVYGLQVRVVSSSSGAVICDATVTVSDGAYREQVHPFMRTADGPADCFYSGAGERAGTYTINVIDASSRKTISDIVVGHDECHVIPRQLTVAL